MVMVVVMMVMIANGDVNLHVGEVDVVPIYCSLFCPSCSFSDTWIHLLKQT